MVGVGVVGVERQRPAEIPIGRGPVPLVHRVDVAEGSVRRRERAVQLQRRERGGLGAGIRLVGWEIAPERQHGVDVGQGRVGEGELGVQRDRLLQEPASLVEAGGRALMPGVAAPEIEVVGAEVAGRALLHVAPLPGGKRHAELAGHPLGDVRLHMEDVGERCVERLLPATGAARRLDQLGAHPHAAPASLLVPPHGAGEQVVHPELASDLPRRLRGREHTGRSWCGR